MNVEQTMEMLDGERAEKLFAELYGADQTEEQKVRYRELLNGYRDKFGETIRTTTTGRCWRAASTWTAWAWRP